ncbi:peroxisomal 2,4-dienoyl-CoA reductase [(3E)-enoyl-CoA-producing]-like [Styela clava]|uniref:peroxisomal 2,4-dienoyl-CoA reductase-like n=1 Tax=Styela clava TaxID=7725 RepID=UPI00193A5C3D|nr:peroxisomal 2,4-dienoyl-CoA reductase-like [Styela clava]
MSAIPRNTEVELDECLSHYKYVFNPNLLQGQVAFITGGGSGIGFRIAEIFMRHGCDTAIASRRLEKVKESAKKLEKATGKRCLALAVDVRKPKEIEETVDEVLKHYKKIDILVNNAAGNFICDAENLSYNAFKTVIEIDTIGTFNTSKAVFAKWFKQNGGNIVNITATLAYKGDALQVHAGSAKAAIDAMTKHLAVEWGGNGVRINGIAPGPVEGTEGLRKLAGGMADQVKTGIPLQRLAQKCEIADMAVFLSSNAAAYMTGTVLVADGGNWLTSFNNFNMLKQVLPKPKI